MIQTGLILWILYQLNAPTWLIWVGWLVFTAKTFCCLADILD